MKDKRQKKRDQHFPILCNGRKANILHYKVTPRPETGLEDLEIVTKLPSEALNDTDALLTIEIPKDGIMERYVCRRYARHGKDRYCYKVIWKTFIHPAEETAPPERN